MLYANATRPRETVSSARAEDGKERVRAPLGPVAAFLLGAVLLAGCDFEVTNPGPVADAFLDNPGAHQAIINGAQRELNYAMNTQAMDVGNRMREITAGDVSPWEGITYNGFLGLGSANVDPWIDTWGPAHAARWITADALRRFAEVEASADVVTQAHLWHGWALRIMGEYFCEVAYDAGPALPGRDALERAEQSFTAALSGGGTEETTMAARAGRAQIRVNLGDWAGAVADASGVPTDWSFVLRFFQGPWRYNNAWAQWGSSEGAGNLGAAGGAYTIWNTQWVDYYTETNDPRVPWVDSGIIQNTALTEWTVREFPFYAQSKYTALDDDIELASGEEMRLIEAEALLRTGDMAGAMALVNSLRDRAGVDPVEATNMDEAWTLFMRERGIELWLEGRRMADIRRWTEDGTPGELHPIELGITPYGGPDLSNRALCLPITEEEIDQNPNLSL